MADADSIRRRDEILQVMFWMRGEGLGDAVGVDDLHLFLNEAARETLAGELEGLAAIGLIESAGDGRFRLSEAGLREGGRRFTEEFEDFMRQGHGACSDPHCDCHALGPEACTHTHERRGA